MQVESHGKPTPLSKTTGTGNFYHFYNINIKNTSQIVKTTQKKPATNRNYNLKAMMQYSPSLHNFIVNKHVFLLQQAIGAVSLLAIVLREQWIQFWLHYANISPHELPFQIKNEKRVKSTPYERYLCQP